MKKYPHWITTTVILASLLILPAPAAESLSVLLQRAIFAEETEGNLDAAIKIYEQIAAETAANRSVATQAQFRLALCYQKKGDKVQAIKLLNELIQQSPLDAGMGRKARETMAELGIAPTEAVSVRRIPLSGTPGWIVAVSTSGQLAAYQPRGSTDLFVQDLATGKSQLAAKDADMWAHSPPARFSPDGRWIAYDYHEADIHIAKTDGTETRKLFTGTAKAENKPWVAVAGWSADGTQVIMAHWDHARACRVAVALDAKTGAAKEIAPAPDYRGADQWRIADNGRYTARLKSGYPNIMTLLDFESGQEQTVVDRDAGHVIGWTFSDTQLVYTKNGIRGVEIWAVDVRDGKTVNDPKLVSSDSITGFSRGARRTYPLGVARDGRIFYTVEREKPAASELWALEGFLSSSPVAVASAIALTEIPPTELTLSEDRSLVDRKFGVSITQPPSCAIIDAYRYSNGGNKIAFGVSAVKGAIITLSYRPTTPWAEGVTESGPSAHVWGTKRPAPSEVDAWLRDTAERFSQMAEKSMKNYKRDPAGLAPRVVGGHKALSWSASFLRNEVPWMDLCLHIYSENAHALILLRTPVAGLDVTRPAYESMVASFRLP